MKKSIYAIYSCSPQSYFDCLMLCMADSIQNAIERAMNETNILDSVLEDNVCAECLDLKTDNPNYIKIFDNAIFYNS